MEVSPFAASPSPEPTIADPFAALGGLSYFRLPAAALATAPSPRTDAPTAAALPELPVPSPVAVVPVAAQAVASAPPPPASSSRAPAPVTSPAAVAPAADVARAQGVAGQSAGLKLCEQVLSGNMDAVSSLFRTSQPDSRLAGQVALGGDRFAAFDALAAPAATPAIRQAGPSVAAPISSFSQQDFESMDAQKLVDFHAMVTKALHQRQSTAPPPVVSAPLLTPQVPSTGPAASSSSFMPDDWIREEDDASAAKRNAFGDVLDAFHQKEPAWEAKARSQGSSQSRMSGGHPGQTQQQPRPAKGSDADFGDLLSAFQHLGSKS